MKRRSLFPPLPRLVTALVGAVLLVGHATGGDPPAPLPTEAEAKMRALLLHATVHGALQVVHRDFFRREEKMAIPSTSLKDVFKDLEAEFGVKMSWVAGDETIQHEDNKPQDAFEERAIKSIVKGEKEVSEIVDGRYRFVGSIKLQNVCLRCHVPSRKSLEDRFAGLSISMPLAPAPSK